MAKAVAIYVGGQRRLVETMLAGSGRGLEQLAVDDAGRCWHRVQNVPSMGNMWSSWERTRKDVDANDLPDDLLGCIRIQPRDGSAECGHVFDEQDRIRVRLPK